MRTLLSFIAILLLATSSLPIGFADITPVDSSNIVSIEQPIIQTRKTISVNLDESIELTTDAPRKKQIQNTSVFIADDTSKSIHFDEDLILLSSTSDQKIHFDSIIIQPQITIERILQTDKPRDDRKKNLKIESIHLDDLNQQQSEDLISIDSNIPQTTFFADPFNLISDLIFEQNLLKSINIFEEQSILNIYNSISNFDSSILFDNSFIVVIFAPLVFFLFIFAEDVKFKFEKIRPILSLVCVFIILSTVILTPYSISSSYWPEAYADTGDMNDIIYDNTTTSDDTSSSSTPAEDTETSEDTTSNTDASVGSTSSSSTPAEDTESTEVSTTNSTTTEIIPVNGTVIPGTNSTEIIPVNGTVIPGTNSTMVTLPNATESWSFDTQINGSRFLGDVYIEESDSSLILDGDGYLSNDGNSTSDLSNLSVTAWVNPDYSGGSAEFTVISKENAFALTINNNITPQHIATFSVFDGIKWHTVQTLEEIGNDWSHIAATFNGTTLSIYTNGIHSNTNKSIEKIELTIDGQLEVKTIETIESTSDVIVGASLDNNRSLDDVTKQFYGEIKEVNVFNVYLTAEQVTKIYLQTLPMIESLYNNTAIEIIEEDIVIIDVFVPITNSTNINGTNIDIDTTNSTDTIITFNETQNYIPIEIESLNEELNKLTISTWINPSYISGSAEFTVVSKESSFVLGINNIYSPEKVSTFSIFDGITWTKLSGVTEINDWSHLVAVINGTEISLYLNGNLESQTTIPESFTILEGEVSPVSAEIAENESDLIIGAYLNTLRSKVTLSNHFSGAIDDVLIYKEALSQAQINEIYTGYVTPSENYSIPFESHLLSFTDTITVLVNNSTVSDTIHVASIDSTSEIPLVTQSLSFADYVTYKLNESTNESSVEVMVFSDVVVATIIPAETIEDNNESSISELLSFSDVVVATIIPAETIEDNNKSSISELLVLDDSIVVELNGNKIITLSESLQLDSILLVIDDKSNNITNFELGHSIIEINKPVIWTHNVTFYNNTESVAIEIPVDAEILIIKTLNETSETVLFDSTEYSKSNYTGLYDDEDITDKDLKKYFRLIDSVQTIESKINNTSEKILYYANLDTAKAHKKLDKLNANLDKLENKLENKLEKLSGTIPLASLQQVSEMLQQDKPLKVLLLNNTDDDIELTFTTSAPTTLEQDNSTNDKFNKKVTVSHESALHYTNVTAYSDLPEKLVDAGIDFKLFWNINNTRVNVTDDPRFAIEFVDTDDNGIVDQMQWIVPQLSEQEFDIEADLEIINVQSYPAVGGNWKVKFTTNGTADLIITAVNGTTFGTESPDDLNFLELNNGTHKLNPVFNGSTITYYNYSSTEEGFEESQVLTPFAHHLMFQFGNKTAFAHNSAFVPNGPKVILLHGTPTVKGLPDIEDDLVLTASPLTPVIPNWKDPADRQNPIYIHSTAAADCDDEEDLCSEIQVTEAGTYRVNYGLTAEKNVVTQTRYQAVSYLQNDTDGTGGYNANGGMSCFDSSYSRPTTDHLQTLGWSSECLVELEANGKVRVGLSKVSVDGGSTNLVFETDENWFQMQKIENPTISLRKTGGTLNVDETGIDMTFVNADIVTHDTGTFTFDGSTDNAEITVETAGLYKVSYSAVYFLSGTDRSAYTGKIQTNSTGSFVDDIYGGSVGYTRGVASSGILHGALSSSTILELDTKDAIKFVSTDQNNDDHTATNYHLDVEYIGTSSSANVLRVYNATGGLDLDVGTYSDTGGENEVFIDWDTSDEIGSHFTFSGTPSTPTEEITVNISGVYHISYGIDSDQVGSNNQRFGQKTRVEVQTGGIGDWNNAKACFGDSFARGLSSGEHYTATSASSCMLELEISDKIRIVSAHESDPNTSADQITTANELYLTIQSLTISNPSLEENLLLDDTVEASIIFNNNESLSLDDTVEAILDASVSLTETLLLVDDPILIQSAGVTKISFEETLLIVDAPIPNLVLPIKLPESLSFVDTVDFNLADTITY